MKSLSIAVLLGSVRRDRMGGRASTLVTRELERRGHMVHLVDPLELQLPLLDRMYKEHPTGAAPEPLQRLADLYRRMDGFLIVSGEYNHGIPPALKNLLDHFLEEYFFRPSGIICYSAGGFGGVRAAMQLRMTLAELGMSSIPSLLPIPRIGEAIDDQGIAQNPIVDHSANRFLDEFLWYASALAEARAKGTPY
ncbi:MAG: NADPH-dependent FMN reductase [Sphingomicrobium sp.]